MKPARNTIPILLVLVLFLPAAVAAEKSVPRDAAALDGLRTGKAVYDVRTSDPKALLFILKVIDETEKGMKKQGVEPEFIISFRGGTLPLLKADPETDDVAGKAILREVRERLAVFREGGAKLEACNVAATLFGVDKTELTEDVTLIGNSIISLIGYQNKGYAIVPMY